MPRKTPARKASADRLTDKQRAFVEHYLVTWNASEAARRAGYSKKTANEQGSRMLAKVSIQALIQQRIGQLKMTADEVMLRLADQARGSLEDFLDDSGVVDLIKARAAGKMHLLKSYSLTDKGVRIEHHDSQAALVQLGRILNLFTDRVEQIDLTKLTDAQLERLAKGENVYSVLATPGPGRN